MSDIVTMKGQSKFWELNTLKTKQTLSLINSIITILPECDDCVLILSRVHLWSIQKKKLLKKKFRIHIVEIFLKKYIIIDFYSCWN